MPVVFTQFLLWPFSLVLQFCGTYSSSTVSLSALFLCFEFGERFSLSPPPPPHTHTSLTPPFFGVGVRVRGVGVLREGATSWELYVK